MYKNKVNLMFNILFFDEPKMIDELMKYSLVFIIFFVINVRVSELRLSGMCQTNVVCLFSH